MLANVVVTILSVDALISVLRIMIMMVTIICNQRHKFPLGYCQVDGANARIPVMILWEFFMPPQAVHSGSCIMFQCVPMSPVNMDSSAGRASPRPQGGRVHYTHAVAEASYDRARSLAF